MNTTHPYLRRLSDKEKDDLLKIIEMYNISFELNAESVQALMDKIDEERSEIIKLTQGNKEEKIESLTNKKSIDDLDNIKERSKEETWALLAKQTYFLMLKSILIKILNEIKIQNFNSQNQFGNSEVNLTCKELAEEGTLKILNKREIRFNDNIRKLKKGYKTILIDEFRKLYKKLGNENCFSKKIEFTRCVLPIIRDKLNILPEEWKEVDFNHDL